MTYKDLMQGVESKTDMKKSFLENINGSVQEFNLLREQYLTLKFLDDELKAIDKRVKQEVLKENEFIINGSPFEEENGKRLTNPNQDYNLNDVDFKRYMKLTHTKRIKYDIVNVESEEYITNLETLEQLNKAEISFMEVIYRTLPDTLKPQIRKVIDGFNYKLKEKLIEIGLKLDTKNLEEENKNE